MTTVPEDPIMQVERAAGDARRGVPVIIIYANGNEKTVIPAEYTQHKDKITDSADAAVKLMKIAGMLPEAVIDWAYDASLLLKVSEQAITGYNATLATSLIKAAEAKVPLECAENARVIAFRPRFGHDEHLAILIGEPEKQASPLTRIHSSCITGDILGSLRCDCGNQLQKAFQEISEQQHGILLYLNQEGRGIGIANKLRAYQLQDAGMDTVEANEALGFAADERDFAIAAQMLKSIGIQSVRLLTNNPAKIKALAEYGIKVLERKALITQTNPHNTRYMDTKASKLGHHLDN